MENKDIDYIDFFKYLGHWLSRDDCDNKAVTKNIQKAARQWGQISRLLKRETAEPKVMARFYLAIIQAILLYGSETWVLTTRLLQHLEHFHA